ncbi:hypothetical protein ONS96_009416 [Cadophora gregata f. sp. sojae]|nr:hypothetical protein ONS96_009416 [Cadophora gregata f. sp. sojae]
MLPKSSRTSNTCKHESLCFTSTSNAQKFGYSRPNLEKRLAAATPNRILNPSRTPQDDDDSRDSKIYPAPLVLPSSEISLYPHEEGQSLRSWLKNNGVNKITPERKTIYISLPPGFGEDVKFMKGWTMPKGATKSAKRGLGLDYELVAKYVEAFYHGLEVKVLPDGWFSWILDQDESSGKSEGRAKAKTSSKSRSRSKTKSRSIDLETEPEDPQIGLRSKDSTEYTVVRSRPTPNYPYSNQLNLNDILDFAIASLPDDAYALLMLLEHDLYEDDDDEFVCGRAYGGSRVSAMSGARYWPGFDEEENVERVHGWPASHCEAHLDTFLGEEGTTRKGKAQTTKGDLVDLDAGTTSQSEKMTPLHRAVQVYIAPSTPKSLTLLHLARIARTASHELGHCFGIGHCTYYACIMQGSAGLAEDASQPPYLCPVDEAKILRATAKGVVSERRLEGWKEERLSVMKRFCRGVVEEWGADGRGSMFECLGEWITGLLEDVDQTGGRGVDRVVIDSTMND